MIDIKPRNVIIKSPKQNFYLEVFMKKFIAILTLAMMLVGMVACSTTPPQQPPAPVTTEAPISLYPDTPEKYIAERYGDGWTLVATTDDAYGFEKDGMHIDVHTREFFERYKYDAMFYRGYFGDNGYPHVANAEITQYFTELLSSYKTAKVVVRFYNLVYPFDITTEKTWEENWDAYKQYLSPTVYIFVTEKLSAEELDAIELALIAPQKTLTFKVFYVSEAEVSDDNAIENILTEQPTNKTLRQRILFQYD
jgi:hypothetical protein